jgi:hypothetical protein
VAKSTTAKKIMSDFVSIFNFMDNLLCWDTREEETPPLLLQIPLGENDALVYTGIHGNTTHNHRWKHA